MAEQETTELTETILSTDLTELTNFLSPEALLTSLSSVKTVSAFEFSSSVLSVASCKSAGFVRRASIQSKHVGLSRWFSYHRIIGDDHVCSRLELTRKLVCEIGAEL